MGRAFAARCGKGPVCVAYLAPRVGFLDAYLPRSFGFENWKHYVEEVFPRTPWGPVPDVAQVNVVNGEAVLRVRREGKVWRRVLTERDPLIYEIEGQKFEILEIFGELGGREVKLELPEESTATVRMCDDCVTYIDVAVRTRGELDLARFRELVRRLAQVALPADLHVRLRRDAWFVPACRFPTLYVFDEEFPPLPNRAEWEAAGELGALVSRKLKEIVYYEYTYDGERRVQVETGREPLEER